MIDKCILQLANEVFTDTLEKDSSNLNSMFYLNTPENVKMLSEAYNKDGELECWLYNSEDVFINFNVYDGIISFSRSDLLDSIRDELE